MSVTLSPYLNFRGNAREAMEFYRSVFGGTLNVQTFGDFHAAQEPGEETLVMHAALDGDNGILLLASDTPNRMEYRPGSNFSMSLMGDDEALLRGYFEKLSDGGVVTMPLEQAAWGDTFGMCSDKFGTSWLINIAGNAAR